MHSTFLQREKKTILSDMQLETGQATSKVLHKLYIQLPAEILRYLV